MTHKWLERPPYLHPAREAAEKSPWVHHYFTVRGIVQRELERSYREHVYLWPHQSGARWENGLPMTELDVQTLWGKRQLEETFSTGPNNPYLRDQRLAEYHVRQRMYQEAGALGGMADFVEKNGTAGLSTSEAVAYNAAYNLRQAAWHHLREVRQVEEAARLEQIIWHGKRALVKRRIISAMSMGEAALSEGLSFAIGQLLVPIPGIGFAIGPTVEYSSQFLHTHKSTPKAFFDFYQEPDGRQVAGWKIVNAGNREFLSRLQECAQYNVGLRWGNGAIYPFSANKTEQEARALLDAFLLQMPNDHYCNWYNPISFTRRNADNLKARVEYIRGKPMTKVQ